MKTQLFIVSHAKDANWLDWCLQSIRKFCTGFEGVTVVAPTADQLVLGGICGANGARLRLFDQAPPPKCHLDHNVQKCCADLWCPDVDYICHIDSDCVFREPATPEDYFVDGKPVLLVQTYASLERQFNGFPWRHVVERTLKMPVTWETMRRHPMVNPVSLYPHVRTTVERVNGQSFRDYVLAQKPDYPSGFAEFNTLGAVVMDSSEWRNRYHIIDVGCNPYPRTKLIQFWSHGSPDANQDIWIDGKLTPVVPRQMISQILGK